MEAYDNDFNQIPNLTTLYRFEGVSSFHYHNFNQKNVFDNTSRYIYFSKSKLHHKYYVKQKIRQLINGYILDDVDFKLNKYSLSSHEKYQEMAKRIENSRISDCISIEINLSSLMEILLNNNYVFRHLKEGHVCYVERVDVKRPGDGGYGFSKEWLEIYNVLTYFYTYQKISKNDLLYFIEATRYNIVHDCERVNTMEFLEKSNNRVVKVNEKLNDNFSKYELMDILERILDKKLYLPDSCFDIYQSDIIKKTVKEYSLEREKVLEAISESQRGKVFTKK